jgi:hypothetical protein
MGIRGGELESCQLEVRSPGVAYPPMCRSLGACSLGRLRAP